MSKDEKKTLGKLLLKTRLYNGIERESICLGCCDEQMYYRIERNQTEPDGLLFALLWERLGVSLFRMNIILAEEGNEWYKYKEKAYNAILLKDIESAEVLREKMGKIKGLNLRIQSQFLKYLDYAIEMMKTGFSKSAYENIKEAVYCTIGNPFEIDFSQRRIGQEEVHLLCSFFMAHLRVYSSDAELIRRSLYDISKKYIDTVFDNSASAGALSRIAATEIKCFDSQANREMISCAVDRIRGSQSIYDLPLLLLYLGEECTDAGKRNKKWGEVLSELYSEFGGGYIFREELVHPQLPHICKMQDFIKTGRLDKGFTQEKISEGILEPENYSRIENGRRKPHKDNLKRIIQRLDLEWGYFQGIILTDEYECVLKRIEAEYALREEDRKKCLENLEYLESKLDMQICQNKQYCEHLRISLDLKEGRVSPEVAEEKLTNLLKLTEADDRIIRYYSPQESTIMLSLATLYRRRLNKPDKALDIIERYLRNELRKEFPNISRIYEFKRVLAGIYGDQKEWEKEENIAYEGLTYIFTSNQAGMLEQFLDLYLEGKSKGSIKKGEEGLLVSAAYMADLYNEHPNSRKLKKYLETNFQKSSEWY